jgi:hypothetical protein
MKWRVNMAVRKSNLPSAARLVMFVLSDMADAKTGLIPMKHSPSLADLARETGLGQSTVKAQLASLEQMGWVRRSRPTGGERARHVPTYYQLMVGSPGEERAPAKRNPMARSKPSEEGPDGQEQAIGDSQEMAIENESDGQEQADRWPGDSSSMARSKPSYIKDYDLYDLNDRSAADAATPPAQEPEEPKRKRSSGTRKTAKPKEPDPLGDVAQELTVAFVEAHGQTNVQPFVAIRGVAKATLARKVPRDVVAAAMEAVANNGFPISGATMTVELNRMWKAANPGSSGNGGRKSAAQQRVDEGMERAERMRQRDEAEARGEFIPNLIALPGGRTA